MLNRTIQLIAVLCLPVAAADSVVPTESYQVIRVYPHDPNAFTQGLVYVDGHLYESTGLNGHSSIRMVELSTGRVVQKYDLPQEYFGEGLTDWGSSLVQLTWKARTAFVYDRFSFTMRRTLHYEGEGWGLTHDATALIMSDGSSILRVLDPKSFREIRRISVHDSDGRPVEQLNELECIRGEVYANIWHADKNAQAKEARSKTGHVSASKRTVGA
jgi:glutaminyl-peptide cyclotransferase